MNALLKMRGDFDEKKADMAREAGAIPAISAFP
jgi:hypothetical protein